MSAAILIGTVAGLWPARPVNRGSWRLKSAQLLQPSGSEPDRWWQSYKLGPMDEERQLD